jgi:predicted RNase H-like nuclease (RuvC/YqgF family)
LRFARVGQEVIDTGDVRIVRLISYHRAGVAKRKARAAMRATRQLNSVLQGVEARNEELEQIVAHQASTIAWLEQELDELHRRIE